MQRFHAYPGTGDGDTVSIAEVKELRHDDGWTPDTKVMRPNDSGHWVRYRDAQIAIDKVKEASRPALEAAKTAAFAEGFNDGVKSVDFNNKLYLQNDDRKRLLNELYHDRARLEDVAKSAANTMRLVLAAINEQLDGTDTYDKEMMENHAGALAAFVELHGRT